MGTLLGVLGGVLGAGLLAAGIYWIRGALRNAVALDERNAELAAEQARVTAMEAADAEQRAARAQRFDAKATAVSDADGAAELLRDALRPRKGP